MVNESLQVLRYRQAALWRVDASVPGFSCVAAVSGLPEPNPNAPYIHWLARVFREAIGRPGSGAVAALSPADLPDLAAEWSEWLPAHVLWVPLAHPTAAVLARNGVKGYEVSPFGRQDFAKVTVSP